MTNAYCTLEDVKSSLSGDVPNMGTSHDQSLVNKILEVSRDMDRKISAGRRESDELWSFLAEQQYGRQRVYLSAPTQITSGSFLLEFDGQTTSAIEVDASSSDVQSALEALSTVGAGNVVVSGFDGGPWTVDFAGALTGPRPTLTGSGVAGVVGSAVVVLPMIQGVSVVPTERRFNSEPDLYGLLLPIDDCVEIYGVRLYDSTGSAIDSYAEGVNYQRYPMRGAPIEALKSMAAAGWPEWPFTIGVEARWGFRTAIPEDARETATIEVIRAHFGALAGNDDRLGMTPFGAVTVAKAFTSKFKELVADYSRKLW